MCNDVKHGTAPVDAHTLASAVEKALGWREGTRDAELDSLLEQAMAILNVTPAAPGIDHLRSVINALSRNISDAYEKACQNGDERMQTVQNARQSLLNTIREALPQSDASPKGGSTDPLKLPCLPFAVFDEFGVGADDRVADYGRACATAAMQATSAVVVK